MTTQPSETQPPETIEQRVARLEGAYPHLATKADLARAEGVLKADIADVKADIARVEARMDARMAEMEARLIKWMVGAIIGVAAVFTAIVRLLG